jgi:hypothetical protein
MIDIEGSLELFIFSLIFVVFYAIIFWNTKRDYRRLIDSLILSLIFIILLDTIIYILELLAQNILNSNLYFWEDWLFTSALWLLGFIVIEIYKFVKGFLTKRISI